MSDAPHRDEPSLGELFGQLAQDARAFGEAELEYYRTLARTRAAQVRSPLLYLALAVALALGAAIALVVGLVLTLTPIVGPGWATSIVVVAIGVLAGLLAWSGIRRLKRVFGGRS